MVFEVHLHTIKLNSKVFISKNDTKTSTVASGNYTKCVLSHNHLYHVFAWVLLLLLLFRFIFYTFILLICVVYVCFHLKTLHTVIHIVLNDCLLRQKFLWFKHMDTCSNNIVKHCVFVQCLSRSCFFLFVFVVVVVLSSCH